MRTGSRILVAAAAIVAVGLLAPDLPALLRDSGFLRVHEVRFEGMARIEAAELEPWADIPSDFALWMPVGGLESRIATHPLVRSVEVVRRFPASLEIRVEEREPVVFVADADGLRPVDAEGRTLPIDPVHRPVDLPLLAPDPRATPSDERIARIAREVDRLRSSEPDLHAAISDLSIPEGGGIEARLSHPRVSLLFEPPLPRARLAEALLVLQDAGRRMPEREVIAIDLRFSGQVLVRSVPRPPAAS